MEEGPVNREFAPSHTTLTPAQEQYDGTELERQTSISMHGLCFSITCEHHLNPYVLPPPAPSVTAATTESEVQIMGPVYDIPVMHPTSVSRSMAVLLPCIDTKKQKASEHKRAGRGEVQLLRGRSQRS